MCCNDRDGRLALVAHVFWLARRALPAPYLTKGEKLNMDDLGLDDLVSGVNK